MARFFVSYSRSVKDEVRKLVDLLLASGHEVWWDADIPIMADWWATILSHIEWCEVFIFVASQNSVNSPYCLAELSYANNRQRPILPFMLDDPTTLQLPPELPARNQWLLYDGDPSAMLRQINQAYRNVDWRLHQDIPVPRPPEPQKSGQSLAQLFQNARSLADQGHYDAAKQSFRNIKQLDFVEWGDECEQWIKRITSYSYIVDLAAHDSTLERARRAWQEHERLYGDDFDPQALQLQVTRAAKSRRFNLKLGIGLLFLGLISIFLVMLVLTERDKPKNKGIEAQSSRTISADSEDTAIADAIIKQTSLAASNTPSLTLTFTSTPEPSPSYTLTPLVPSPTLNLEERALATVNAIATLTEEARFASAEAELLLTQIAYTTATYVNFAAGQTSEAIVLATRVTELQSTQITWTAIPSSTFTVTPSPTHTLTPSLTPSSTSSFTPQASATPDPTSTMTYTPIPTATLSPAERAFISHTANSAWQPYITEQLFDGVAMVLVPAGCFMMGDIVRGDASPRHEQCIDTPFWIDKYEVSQEQFTRLNAVPLTFSFVGDNLPVENITWSEARQFCMLRNGRLPTESEWEYAARGPSNLTYAWGSFFISSNLAYGENTNNRSQAVGSYPHAASWVGALDMNGNVWELTNSAYVSYPYDADDGREAYIPDDQRLHVIRGGSWFTMSTQYLRNSTRNSNEDNQRYNDVGFRCVRDLQVADFAKQNALNYQTSNTAWQAYITEESFAGVPMVLVPAGCFTMGSNVYENEEPPHVQCIDTPFWIDKYEVSQEQFSTMGGRQEAIPGFSGANLPIEGVTWLEARDFCTLRDGRLPTEAEWEYAARGPDNLIYPWGNTFIAENTVYQANSNDQTAPIGSRTGGVSWVGAFDMSGNVWEWTNSLYALYPYDPIKTQVQDSPDTDRLYVLRGGSWFDGGEYEAFLRASARNPDLPTVRYISFGFRCVRPFS